MRTLLVRADASHDIGAGHLMRTLALGQAWQERGGEVHYLVNEDAQPFCSRLLAEGFWVHVLSTTDVADVASGLKADAAVVDGYGISEATVSGLEAAGITVMVVDDNGERVGTSASWILNPNLHAASEDYAPRQKGLLLGLRYTPLRREFRLAQVRARAQKADPNVLVTLGGSDPNNATTLVVRALCQLADSGVTFVARVILGPAFGHSQEVHEQLSEVRFPVETVSAASSMVRHYQWADVAISGSGSTTWELIALRVPQCAVVIADNQIRLAHRLRQESAALVLSQTDLETAQAKSQETLRSLLTDFEPTYGGPFADLDRRGALRAVDAILEKHADR